jgi:ribosomal-protein-alanine N-acetyltransferase
VRLITTGGFEQVRLARVEAWVEPHNTRSVAVLTASGFELEGRLRSFLALPSGRSDALVYSRISDHDLANRRGFTLSAPRAEAF